jgi:hypothetical protein
LKRGRERLRVAVSVMSISRSKRCASYSIHYFLTQPLKAAARASEDFAIYLRIL